MSKDKDNKDVNDIDEAKAELEDGVEVVVEDVSESQDEAQDDELVEDIGEAPRKKSGFMRFVMILIVLLLLLLLAVPRLASDVPVIGRIAEIPLVQSANNWVDNLLGRGGEKAAQDEAAQEELAANTETSEEAEPSTEDQAAAEGEAEIDAALEEAVENEAGAENSASDEAVAPENGASEELETAQIESDGQEQALATDTEAEQAVEQVEEISDAPAVDAQMLSALQADVDAAEAEKAKLQAEIEALKAKLAAAETANESELAELAQSQEELKAELLLVQSEAEKSEASVAFADLKLAAGEGEEFSKELDALEDAGVKIPASLRAKSEGIPSLVDLQNEYGVYASKAIRASILASGGEGAFDKLKSRVSAEFTGRSLTPQEGNSPDAVLSRAEDALRKGRLQFTLSAVSVLPSEAQEELAPWIALAEERLSVLAEIDALIPNGQN